MPRSIDEFTQQGKANGYIRAIPVLKSLLITTFDNTSSATVTFSVEYNAVILDAIRRSMNRKATDRIHIDFIVQTLVFP